MIGTTAAIIMGASALAGKAVGSKMASNASKDAAKIQSDASDKALAYNQHATDQSLDFLRQNQDRANGVGPSAPRSALSTLLGLTPTTAGGGSYSPMAPTSTSSPFTMPGQPPPQGGGMVMMRAPNGQQQRVPAAQVEHYRAQGAQVIS